MVKIARAMAKRPIKNPESENTIQNQASFFNNRSSSSSDLRVCSHLLTGIAANVMIQRIIYEEARDLCYIPCV